MIISRTPLRVSLFGGGTDLPEFYEKYGGAILSFAINKYVYVTLHDSFDESYRIAYSEVEIVNDLFKIKNPVVRESIMESGLINKIEVTTVADVPSKGTGLASSSAFSIGLLNALAAYEGKTLSQEVLAERAYLLERNRIGDPVGKQDHYGTAIGGMKLLEIENRGTVNVTQIEISRNIQEYFLPNLLIVYTGITRSAKSLLLEQQKSLGSNIGIGNYLDALNYAKHAYSLILEEKYDEIGLLLATAWSRKKQTYSGVTNSYIDAIVSRGLQAGALGAKLLGAGGGGFILFYAPANLHHKIINNLSGIRALPFKVDKLGTKILFRESDE
jgi:D-glycero-alpha-D-manno-heptose-7-phosphate kinase